jgi:hypothetical protein
MPPLLEASALQALADEASPAVVDGLTASS